ncbi:MAG: hypothetical protein ABSG89_01540 [Bacteroidales bacterium]
MSKNLSDKETRNDEVDLLDLFRRMGRTISGWFNSIGVGLIRVIVFFARNIIVLLASILIGLGISYLLKIYTRPVYVSEITLRSNSVPNSDMIDYFNKLTVILKEKNFSNIASSMGIMPQTSLKIRNIAAYWVIDRNKDNIPDYVDYRKRFNVYDTLNTRMQDRFVVSVKVSDPAIFPEISKGLIHYAMGNRSFIESNEFRLSKADEMLARLKYDIKQLDSLQKVKYFEETRNRIPTKEGQMIFLQEQKTQLVYDDIYSLYGKKQSFDREKFLYPDILTILSDFYQPLKRHNGVLYYGYIVIPSIFGLTLLFLILYRSRKKLRQIYERY